MTRFWEEEPRAVEELEGEVDYDAAMRIGAELYSDVLASLADAGLSAAFTQTGGMCAALEVELETGNTLLITDEEEPLPWEREQHHGWRVELYPPAGEYDGCSLACASTSDGGSEALLELVQRVLATTPGDRQ